MVKMDYLPWPHGRMRLSLFIRRSMDKNEVLVSIRCLAYNHAPYIRQCLEGFVIQKTNFRIEAVVHDDASTDGTAEIIREYAERYPDLIKPIFETENQYSKHDGSLGRIVNSACVGKYIAMCEGDDYWIDPYKLQKQVDFLEANLLYSACAHQSQVIGKGNGLFMTNVPDKIEMKHLLSRSRLFHTASFIYRSVPIKNLPQIERSVLSGDKLLFLKCVSIGPIKYMDDVMCVYRKHDTGASSTVLLQDLKADLNIIPYMQQICKKFPKYRYLSFLYGTFALYPTDINFKEKLRYLLLSFLFSFSYFPKNILELISKVIRYVK